MTYEEAEKHKFNPFDLTKVWSHKDFPLIPVGKLTLNRNPSNYFSEVGQDCLERGVGFTNNFELIIMSN